MCSLQYVSLRGNVCGNSNTANTVSAKDQIKFSNKEMWGSVDHFLEKSMFQALSISFKDPGCR
jgi:hypothetical protein